MVLRQGGVADDPHEGSDGHGRIELLQGGGGAHVDQHLTCVVLTCQSQVNHVSVYVFFLQPFGTFVKCLLVVHCSATLYAL